MKNHPIKQTLQTLIILASAFLFIGCNALGTSLNKSKLDVQTKASESIFLEPVRPDRRIIFVSVRNTSDKQLNIKSRIKKHLSDSGYKVTEDPDKAQYMLQANILKIGEDNQKSPDSYIESGFSGALLGNAVSSDADSVKGAVIGSVLGVIADSMVDDVLFIMVTDLQIRERPRTKAEWKTHRTRIVSTANQVNLKFEEALPKLEDGLIKSISGIFIE